MTRQTSPTYRSTAKLKVCKETFLPKCCYQMRIGYITCVIYNTPDNLRIALEDNLIENSAKKSENHKLRINTNSHSVAVTITRNLTTSTNHHSNSRRQRLAASARIACPAFTVGMTRSFRLFTITVAAWPMPRSTEEHRPGLRGDCRIKDRRPSRARTCYPRSCWLCKRVGSHLQKKTSAVPSSYG